MESQNPRKAVFIRRKKGMPFDEFVKVCIKRFREAGLLQDGEVNRSGQDQEIPGEEGGGTGNPGEGNS